MKEEIKDPNLRLALTYHFGALVVLMVGLALPFTVSQKSLLYLPSMETSANAMIPLMEPIRIYHIDSPVMETNNGQVIVTGWHLTNGPIPYFAPVQLMNYFTNHEPDPRLELISTWGNQIIPIPVAHARSVRPAPQVKVERTQHVQ